MLTARPTRLHRHFFTRYFHRRARTMLCGLWLRDAEKLGAWNRDNKPKEPLLIVANHSSWWDAVMPILLSLDLFDHDAYGIMEERQLRRYGFFRRLGMFSIDRENPRSALRSLGYAADLLRGTGRVLWLFPQGEILPNDRRPLRCYSGTARLIELIGECSVLPIAFRYELLREERPIALASVGAITKISPDDSPTIRLLTEKITSLLTAEVDRLRDDFRERELEGFSLALQGKGSINSRWDRVRKNYEL